MILPDLTAAGLDVLIVGTAVSEKSDLSGHYYANTARNSFWRLLHEAGFTARQLDPTEDEGITAFGIGLSDLNKTVSQSNDKGLSYDFERFHGLVRSSAPRWVAFNGMRAGERYARFERRKKPEFGEQPGWMIEASRVFVLPSSSNNYAITFSAKLAVWTRLAECVSKEHGINE